MKINNKKRFAAYTSLITMWVIVMVVFGYWAWGYFVYPSIPDTSTCRSLGLAVPDNKEYASLVERAAEAEKFANSHGLSTRYALFVDYGVPSGTPRLYVWDFNKKRIIARTYVMHGPGGGSTAKVAKFSNKPGSNCSSLGRFYVTKQHGNRNKTGFLLQGMDIDNHTAHSRGLMLHSSPWVDGHCWMKYIPLHSASCMGCVTVSTRGLSYISKLIKSEEKHIMLWNYCSK